jgi:uncharacterized protein (DUF305 family)
MTQSNEQRIFNAVILPFAAYLFTFVGMGLVAGSVVHFGQTDQIPRFLSIGMVGMALFILSSYIQEKLLNDRSVQKGSPLHYVFYSLILAIGIGMISGGTQHFVDFPIYASYLLPIGFLLALVAYVIRNNLSLTRKGWSWLLGGALLIALPTFLGLNHYAQALPANTGHSHGAAQSTPAASPATDHSGHDMTVTNDRDFLLGMVPHHQEAVESSAYVLTRTDHPELQAFMQRVIEVQAKEVHQMKAWYQDWEGKPYQDNGRYVPMMGAMNGLEGAALDKAYIEGMIGHHQGAIAMAQQILAVTQRSEVKQMAEAIVRTQSQEVEELRSWLGGASSQGNSQPSPTPHDHSGGHNH